MSESEDNQNVYVGGQKYHRDRISSITWALIFIWAGLVFLAGNMGWVRNFSIQLPGVDKAIQFYETWPLIFLGAGVILLIETVARAFIPGTRKHFTAPLIMALVCIGVAFGQVYSWMIIGPIILIGLGLSFLLRGITNS